MNLRDLLSPEVMDELTAIAARSAPGSLDRVWRFIDGDRSGESPYQRRAKHIFPDLARGSGWLEIDGYAEARSAVSVLESAHAVIADEFRAFTRDHEAKLEIYRATDVPISGWKALYFYRDGERSADAFKACPGTAAAIDRALASWRYPLGEVHFSVLESGSSIQPHCDLMNFSISFHLAVITPPDCAIRVGDETRPWHEGRCLLFDHSFEHEAWNRSTQRRVGLIADVWNPYVSPVEREAMHIVFRFLYDEFNA